MLVSLLTLATWAANDGYYDGYYYAADYADGYADGYADNYADYYADGYADNYANYYDYDYTDDSATVVTDDDYVTLTIILMVMLALLQLMNTNIIMGNITIIIIIERLHPEQSVRAVRFGVYLVTEPCKCPEALHGGWTPGIVRGQSIGSMLHELYSMQRS